MDNVTYCDIETNGVSLHCAVAGEGTRPAILLHGFPECEYSWNNQIPLLAQEFKVIAPQLRGYGRSSKPRSVCSYTMREVSADIAGLIKSCGDESALVIGHDWGGIIAWRLAAFYPELIERLVIINAPHPVGYLRNVFTDPRQLLHSWYAAAFQLPWLPEWWIARDDFAVMRRTIAASARRNKRMTEETIARMLDGVRPPGALTAAINYYRAGLRCSANRQDYRTMPPIEADTRIIWGRDDAYITLRNLRGFKNHVTGKLDLEMIDNCGHWPMLEAPAEVNRVLAEMR